MSIRILAVAFVVCVSMFSNTLVAQSRTLTNADLIQMVQAGFGRPTIDAAIATSELNLDLSARGIAALRAAGMDDPWLQAITRRVTAQETAKAAAAVAAQKRAQVVGSAGSAADTIRNLKTMTIVVHAVGLSREEVQRALMQNGDFRALGISVVDERTIADAVLDVNYTFAWDYPFTLTSQGVLLASGKGYGPFSVALGATDVAKKLTALLKSGRQA